MKIQLTYHFSHNEYWIELNIIDWAALIIIRSVSLSKTSYFSAFEGFFSSNFLQNINCNWLGFEELHSFWEDEFYLEKFWDLLSGWRKQSKMLSIN
jgi:hypothetical protein